MNRLLLLLLMLLVVISPLPLGSNREWSWTLCVLLASLIALLWLGLYPQPVLDLAQPVLDGLHQVVVPSQHIAALGPAGAGQ